MIRFTVERPRRGRASRIIVGPNLKAMKGTTISVIWFEESTGDSEIVLTADLPKKGVLKLPMLKPMEHYLIAITTMYGLATTREYNLTAPFILRVDLPDGAPMLPKRKPTVRDWVRRAMQTGR